MLDLNLVRKRFGKEIALYRITKGISQEDMAKKLDISRASLSKLENGSNPIDDHVLLSLYRVCKKYKFFMLLYAFYGDRVRKALRYVEKSASNPLLIKLVEKLKKRGPVDKPRYYDNDAIRVVYKRNKNT